MTKKAITAEVPSNALAKKRPDNRRNKEFECFNAVTYTKLEWDNITIKASINLILSTPQNHLPGKLLFTAW